ncbi:MAG: sigma-70 family RNA polymerase sigma factor [Flavobacteriales bacterium]|nr:sigma-70 family RNA polymerase sigma factor [Flavobacteriales bacterium]
MGIFGRNYKTKTDEDLMQAIVKGDSLAFEELYNRYSKPMVNFFCRMLWKDKEKAQDFMQDLFTKIVHKPDSYDASRSFKTWIYSVANNMCKNEYRKQEVRKNTVNMGHENFSVIDEAADQSKKVDHAAFNELLHKELENLEEIQRTTFLLRYKMDLSIKEIAEITEASEGTVKSRIFYTIKKLSEKLRMFDPKLSNAYEK